MSSVPLPKTVVKPAETEPEAASAGDTRRGGWVLVLIGMVLVLIAIALLLLL